MNKNLLIVIFSIIILVGITAGVISLFPYNPTKPPAVNFKGYTEQGVKDLVSSNNSFSFDLYNQLKLENPHKNIFFSPYSISSAFSMLYEGSANETKQKLKSVFKFPEPEQLAPNFAKIYTTINKKNKSYTLRTGNALWIAKDYKILEDYTKRVSKYYGGKSVNLDFVNDTENSRLTINDFISEQTNKKINDLIKLNMISPDTRLVLTNAIYFEGEWKVAFKETNTETLKFTTDSKELIDVNMMLLTGEEIKNSEYSFKYKDLITLQILKFPYKGDLSMILVLPTEDLNSLGEITFEKYSNWVTQLNTAPSHKLNLISFPKFEFETEYVLNNTLESMGLSLAFTPGLADFSRISGQKDLFVSAAVHKAYVKVDEKGTTATAATAIVMMTRGIMEEQKLRETFIADHPFLFIIQEDGTGEILFLGEVNNPSS
ncbi:MAG: serpin family protein [archaeon]|jgi:serpin B|nr:serpin family protein [archaeon]MDD2478078.1 serpin family protein [Candidatus ainarchaeum sp.]MDD3085023.1 serpin family protein [Candidatus ainarchaeum sp.]MDD4221490.1 serpin family protein [Candidatus ainarchaeum sp.]MDD4663014.1 serpin family protein [Candidatus ainarchaeum sp.]